MSKKSRTGYGFSLPRALLTLGTSWLLLKCMTSQLQPAQTVLGLPTLGDLVDKGGRSQKVSETRDSVFYKTTLNPSLYDLKYLLSSDCQKVKGSAPDTAFVRNEQGQVDSSFTRVRFSIETSVPKDGIDTRSEAEGNLKHYREKERQVAYERDLIDGMSQSKIIPNEDGSGYTVRTDAKVPEPMWNALTDETRDRYRRFIHNVSCTRDRKKIPDTVYVRYEKRYNYN